MDVMHFMHARRWNRDALCCDPVMARLALVGLDASINRAWAQRVWTRGELLGEARKMAARLGLVETPEPVEGDVCVVRTFEGAEALALSRCADWVLMLDEEGRPVAARLDVLAAFHVPEPPCRP